MRKRVFGRQLSRDANERKALFKGLVESLVMLERIETTEAKARAIRGLAEKLVTKAKNRGQEARQFLQPFLTPAAVEKVIADLAPRFANRPGGYTRVVKLGTRFADNARMAVIEWVEHKELSNTNNELSKKENKKVTKTEKVAAEVKVEKPIKKTSAKKPSTKTSAKKGKTVKKNA